MTALKEQAKQIVNQLPDDATWSDLLYEIELRQKIDEGVRDLEEGRHRPHEDVRRRFLET